MAPYGTRIDLYIQDEIRRKWVKTGSSYHATKENFVWFGLGNITKINRLEAILPNGEIISQDDLRSRVIIYIDPEAE